MLKIELSLIVGGMKTSTNSLEDNLAYNQNFESTESLIQEIISRNCTIYAQSYVY
jgi:hypothetical protein